MTVIIKGQIAALPRKNKSGFLLAVEGETKLIPFVFDSERPAFVYKGSFVRVRGRFKRGVLNISSFEDIGHEFSRSDMEALLQNKISVSTEELELILGNTNSVRLLEIAEKFSNGQVEEIKKRAVEVLGNERAGSFLWYVRELGISKSIADIIRTLEARELALDLPVYSQINSFFSYRAVRQNTTVAELLEKDLYLLAHVPGVPGSHNDILKDIDRAVQREGGQLISETRVRGVAQRLLYNYIEKGHAYADALSFRKHVAAIVMRPVKDPSSINNFWTTLNSVIGGSGSGILQDNNYDKKAIYFARTFFSEKRAAERFAMILKASFDEKLETDELISASRAAALNCEGIALNASQEAFIQSVVKNKVTLLIGEAGAGKSATISALCRGYREVTGREPVILGTSGTAAQNTAVRAGVDAESYATIHRFARIETYTKDMALNLPDEFNDVEETEKGLIIVEEASCCDIIMLARLLNVGSTGSRYVFVGDPYQIPPVGPGAVFKTLIELANEYRLPGLAVCELVGAYRQGAGSAILTLARAIRKGDCDEAMEILKGENEGITVYDVTREEVLDKVKEVYMATSEKGVDELLVATFNKQADRRKNNSVTVDTDRLNLVLKSEFEVTDGKNLLNTKFSMGDQVICVRNDYALDVEDLEKISRFYRLPNAKRAKRPTIFNGTKGIVSGIKKDDSGEKTIEIIYKTPMGKVSALYYSTEIDFYVEPALALTVHKAQGQGVPHLILAASDPGGFGRDLLYTAVTRASKKLTLIGPLDVWEEMIKREPEVCNSKLKDRILDELGLLPKKGGDRKLGEYIVPMVEDWG